jgi:hypothetical protein
MFAVFMLTTWLRFLCSFKLLIQLVHFRPPKLLSMCGATRFLGQLRQRCAVLPLSQ